MVHVVGEPLHLELTDNAGAEVTAHGKEVGAHVYDNNRAGIEMPVDCLYHAHAVHLEKGASDGVGSAIGINKALIRDGLVQYELEY